MVYADNAILTFIYIVLGTFGYLAFGEETEPDILKGFKEFGGVVTIIANVLMIVLMICHYPLLVYALRKSIEAVVFKENYKNTKVSILIATIIVVSAVLIGIWLTSIDNVLDFTSSIAGNLLAFILPGVYFIKVG